MNLVPIQSLFSWPVGCRVGPVTNILYPESRISLRARPAFRKAWFKPAQNKSIVQRLRLRRLVAYIRATFLIWIGTRFTIYGRRLVNLTT